jgi:glycosyltransferase involved in cell wall biosynthesis
MQAQHRSTISAFVVCCNEERQIRRCLESVSWCDEIVVVDSGSTDSTLQICGEFTNKIIQKPWRGYVEQKRFALEQCSADWVLNLDADEEVSPLLKQEILGVLAEDAGPTPPSYHGYLVNRVVFFLDRWWRKGGWYPEYRLRLCRRERTTWSGVDPHEKGVVDGPTRRLTGELHHYSFADLTDYMRRMNTLASNAAETMVANGRKASFIDIVVRPWTRFFKFFVLKRGYREGLAGFIVAVIEGVSVFLKYSKVWEKRVIGDCQKETESC